jgi:hypothetical protein
VFRALDSGPLEAWYVDTVHVTEPGADADQALAAQGTVLGGSIAVGALISGGLVYWDPLPVDSALLLPFLVFLALNVVHLVAVLVLLKEPRTHLDATGARRALTSAKEAPAVIRDGLGMLRRNKLLRGIVLVEVFWGTAMFPASSPPWSAAGGASRARQRERDGGHGEDHARRHKRLDAGRYVHEECRQRRQCDDHDARRAEAGGRPGPAAPRNDSRDGTDETQHRAGHEDRERRTGLTFGRLQEEARDVGDGVEDDQPEADLVGGAPGSIGPGGGGAGHGDSFEVGGAGVSRLEATTPPRIGPRS